MGHSHPAPAPIELIESEESLLGAGSRGEVRLARLGDINCAAKIILSEAEHEGSSNPDEELVHPHLVRVYERRYIDGKCFELREFCQGGELFDTVAMNGGLTPDAASTCFSQLLEAVAFCHAAGVANGRLRPEHILIDDSDRVKLLGFRRGGGDGGAQELWRRPCSGLDAPELHGRDTASVSELARADLWALGVVLAGLLMAEPPFAAADAAVCSRYATLVSQGLRVACPELSAASSAPLLSLLERLLRPDPQERPSAEEALAQLRGAPTAVAVAGEAAACAATSSASSSARGGEAAPPATAPPATAAAVLDGAAGQMLRTTQDARAMPPPQSPRVAAQGSGSGSSGSSSSSALMPPPTPPQQPPRVATPRPSPRNGHVRCLGWENLELPFDLLSTAAVATLEALGLPYTVESWVGPLGASFSVRPPPPQEMALPPIPKPCAPALPADDYVSLSSQSS